MLLTDAGILMAANSSHHWNADLAIVSTVFGIMDDLHPKISVLQFFVRQQFVSDLYTGLSSATRIVSIPGQPRNAPGSIVVTPAEISTEVSPQQS